PPPRRPAPRRHLLPPTPKQASITPAPPVPGPNDMAAPAMLLGQHEHGIHAVCARGAGPAGTDQRSRESAVSAGTSGSGLGPGPRMSATWRHRRRNSTNAASTAYE